ncbi:MAG: substrate-binding domain-containing protein, partial [Caldilineaceae bacterium]|nr:substrate-binding domain-containing protein [Caldilineaceae bacterium]
MLPACTLDDIPAAPIDIVGSSTVYPITQHMADLFTASGFGGEVRVEPAETGAGFSRFCQEGLADIVDADRSIQAHEADACRAINREPLAFPIGTDALTLVVSKDNTFIDHLTLAELQAVFVTAKTWADVRSNWPNESIKRIIPGEQSGSLDFFASRLYTEDGRQAFAAAASAIALTPVVDTPESTTAESAVAENAVPEQAPSATPTFVVPTSTPPLAEPTATLEVSQPASTPTDPLLPGFDYSAEKQDAPPFDYVLAWAPERPECLLATQIVQKVIHQNYGLRFVAERYNDLPAMYADFKSVDGAALQRISLCYSDPTDRKYL